VEWGFYAARGRLVEPVFERIEGMEGIEGSKAADS
jgi:hypothetical protein